MSTLQLHKAHTQANNNIIVDSMFMRHMKMGEYNKWDEQKNKKKYTVLV